jgi:hypothetical protein
MYVCLQKFLQRLAKEKGLIRGMSKGPSLVPLAVVDFLRPEESDMTYYIKYGRHLAVISQQNGYAYINPDLTKHYSSGGALYGDYEVVSVHPPCKAGSKRLVRIVAKHVPQPQINWD